MHWLEVKFPVAGNEADMICTQLEELGIEGFVLEDGEDFLKFLADNRRIWDYVDEDLLEQMQGKSSISFYLPDDSSGNDTLKRVEKLLNREIECRNIADEDWSENWKEYYKPVEIAKRLIVIPEWEKIPATDRIPLRLNPGLSFGTGTHATTGMCMEFAELYSGNVKNVLDLGCGSGILSIAARLLGAEFAVGCDIDAKATEIATENAYLNGLKISYLHGDILADETIRSAISQRRYGLIFANIVADVILELLPYIGEWLTDSGVFICSGIIDGRDEEIEKAIKGNGLTLIDKKSREDWHCYAVRGNKKR